MYEAIQQMYIEEEIGFDCSTYTDVIVGQLTYRVHHLTVQSQEEFYSADPNAKPSGYYSYDCDIKKIELMDEHCVVLTDVTDLTPDWFHVRLAQVIEAALEDQN